MNRIRAGLALTAILGIVYAFTSLLVSQREFAVGVIVAATAITLYGLINYISKDDTSMAYEHERDEWRSEIRSQTEVERELTRDAIRRAAGVSGDRDDDYPHSYNTTGCDECDHSETFCTNSKDSDQ